MTNLKLALRNLMRRPLRTFITLTGVSLSLALVQTYHNFTQGVYGYMVEAGVRSGSGHVGIYDRHYLEDRNAALSFDPGDLGQTVPDIKGVAQVMRRLYFSGLAQSSRENRNIEIIGADLEKERAVNPYLKTLPEALFATPWGDRDALVGNELVENLKIGKGRTFVITLQTSEGTLVSEQFRVREVIHTGIRELDSNLVMLDRRHSAAMAGVQGQVHEMAVILNDSGLARQVVPRIEEMLSLCSDLEAVSWEVAMPNLYNALRWDYVSVKAISYIVLLIVTIGVVNTLLMSVMERFQEFGMLRAIGTSAARLCKMILLEALAIGLASMAIGTLLCSLATWYLATYGLDVRRFIPDNLEFGGVIFSALIYAKWDFLWMAQSAGYIVVLCLLAALYPALKAARVAPVAAIAHV